MSFYNFCPDDLVYTKYPARTDMYKLLKHSGTIKRGTVLGLITTGDSIGALTPCNSSNVDGSQTPFAVLAEDIQEELERDVLAPVYIEGTFNIKKLIFSGSDNADTHKAAAKNANLYFVEFVN